MGPVPGVEIERFSEGQRFNQLPKCPRGRDLMGVPLSERTGMAPKRESPDFTGDNDIRNVAITLPSSYYRDGVVNLSRAGIVRCGKPDPTQRLLTQPRQDVRNGKMRWRRFHEEFVPIAVHSAGHGGYAAAAQLQRRSRVPAGRLR